MHWEVKSDKMCGDLLNIMTTWQVFLLVFIADFWFLNLVLSSVIQHTEYCILMNQINDISGIVQKILSNKIICFLASLGTENCFRTNNWGNSYKDHIWSCLIWNSSVLVHLLLSLLVSMLTGCLNFFKVFSVCSKMR